MNIQDPTAAEAAATLRRFIMGFRATQLVYVAAKLGLADLLRDAPQPPYRLAQAVGAEPQALHRLLRALASLGVFAETANGDFALTPMAQLLQTGETGPLRSLALLYGEPWLWEAYGRTLYSVQTGRPAFEHTHGQSFFDYLHDHSAAATLFHDGMSGYSAQEAPAILAGYDFSGVERVVDVGGGQASLVTALLQAYPDLSAVILDLELAGAGARRALAKAGFAERGTFVTGDFFVSIPEGGDLYLLKSVLHNWDDAAAVRILRRCREAMTADARLLVIERVIPLGNAPAEAKLFDINMLVVIGGRERTEGEYRALFEGAGLNLTRIIPTDLPLSLIEGTPASVPQDSGTRES
jgi:hypothetical protein